MKFKTLSAVAAMLAMTAMAGQANATVVDPPKAVASPTDAVAMYVQIGNEYFQADFSSEDWGTNGKNLYYLNRSISFETKEGSLTINGAGFDPDPVLFFSANATNFTNNPLTYSFSFNTPLLPPLEGWVKSHAELGVTLTDGYNNGATVQPLVGEKMLKSWDLFGDGGSVSKNVDIGTKFHIDSGTATTLFSADSALYCGEPCLTMSARLSFTLTGQDSVGFSGKVAQTPVPLPGAAVLFGSALVGLMGARRKKASI